MQIEHYVIVVILLVEPAWARKERSLLSSTKHNTCGQITVSAQRAVPGHTGPAASQKLLDVRSGLGGNLKASVQCRHRSASRAVSRFLLYLDKPPPSRLSKGELTVSFQSLGKLSESRAQLTLINGLISLGPCTKFDCDISA